MGSLDQLLSNYQQFNWVENIHDDSVNGQGMYDKRLIAVCWERLMHVAVYCQVNFKNTINDLQCYSN